MDVTDWRRRIRLMVGLNYESPPEKAIQVRLSVACGHAGLLHDPAPQAFLANYGDTAINYELRA